MFLTGHTGWTDNFTFAFAHKDKLCSPFKKRVHDPSAPYEDCCTVFTPRHPKTKPTLAQVDAACAPLDMEGLIAHALENTELVKVRWHG